MNVSEFLAPANVLIGLTVADKKAALSELAHYAGTKLDLPADAILTALKKRELLGSTGVGGGVAIPHARLANFPKPWGMLVRTRRPIDYDAVDQKPVDLIFLLLLSERSDSEALGPLASIARKLRDPAVAAALRTARQASQMYGAVTHWAQ
jgi:PTS system nitrogen regulatory IIA component